MTCNTAEQDPKFQPGERKVKGRLSISSETCSFSIHNQTLIPYLHNTAEDC